MITIEKYNDKWKSEVSLLSVSPEQKQFTVDKVDEVISTLQYYEHPHLVIEDGKAVGFFILDLAYAQAYDFSIANALGVRSLLIDSRFQGKGIATKAINLLPSYVVLNYPEFKALQLTVNCRNQAAYNCYFKCGFEDTGDLYLGGPAGPQYIMQKKIG